MKQMFYINIKNAVNSHFVKLGVFGVLGDAATYQSSFIHFAKNYLKYAIGIRSVAFHILNKGVDVANY